MSDFDSEISVVIPFYNEEENVTLVINELLGVLPKAEVIAVDDGSTDSTWAVIQLDKRVKGVGLQKNSGQSAALYAGFQQVTRKYCGMMDGDGQNDPNDLVRLVQLLIEGKGDLVGGIRAKRMDTLSRRVASKIANSIRRSCLGDSSKDTGCSMKVFRSEDIALIPPFNGLHRFLPTIFESAGRRLYEESVNHRARKFGESKYSIGGRAMRGVYDLIGVAWLMNRRIVLPQLKRTWIQ